MSDSEEHSEFEKLLLQIAELDHDGMWLVRSMIRRFQDAVPREEFYSTPITVNFKHLALLREYTPTDKVVSANDLLPLIQDLSIKDLRCLDICTAYLAFEDKRQFGLYVTTVGRYRFRTPEGIREGHSPLHIVPDGPVPGPR